MARGRLPGRRPPPNPGPTPRDRTSPTRLAPGLLRRLEDPRRLDSRSLPESGIPDAAAKAEIRKQAGVDWDKLVKAWEYVAEAPGNTGFLVIRHGAIVGEWYRGGDRKSDFLIYSSSKAYTSTAFGLILSDFGGGTTSLGKPLSLDTKVCNAEWLPESLPLPDPRKAEATVRNFLNMASGLGTEAVPAKKPFEWALGHVEGSPFAKLKGDPGTVFNYSNAGVAHLVLVFQRAAGVDLYPFLKERLFDPIGMKQVRWDALGGDGAIGPFSQGYSGIHSTPREHARFCQLALHRGEWAGKRIVPASYYDFAWKSSPANPTYGAQWWVYPRWKEGPDRPSDDLGPEPQRRIRPPEQGPDLRPPRRWQHLSQGIRGRAGPAGAGGRRLNRREELNRQDAAYAKLGERKRAGQNMISFSLFLRLSSLAISASWR